MRVQQKNRNATMLRFFGHYPDPRRIEKPDGSRPPGFYSPKRVRALLPSDSCHFTVRQSLISLLACRLNQPVRIQIQEMIFESGPLDRHSRSGTNRPFLLISYYTISSTSSMLFCSFFRINPILFENEYVYVNLSVIFYKRIQLN